MRSKKEWNDSNTSITSKNNGSKSANLSYIKDQDELVDETGKNKEKY